MKKMIFVFLVGGFIGFLITNQMLQSETVVATSDIDEKLRFISQNEYQDYLKLKDSEEKYKKADELLGKIMLLFLTQLNTQSKNTTETIVVSKTPEPTKTVSSQKEKTVEEVKKTPEPGLSLKEKENKLLVTRSEKEALEILKELELKDIDKQVKNAKSLSFNQLNFLNGKYLGAVTFDDQSEPWRIEWDLNADMVSGEPKGTQLIILSNSKKVFSRTRGSGSIQHTKSFSGESQAILINSYGDDGYIQLYPFAQSGKLFGNYYLKDKSDVLRKVGTVYLQKVN